MENLPKEAKWNFAVGWEINSADELLPVHVVALSPTALQPELWCGALLFAH